MSAFALPALCSTAASRDGAGNGAVAELTDKAPAYHNASCSQLCLSCEELRSLPQERLVQLT